MTTLLPTATPRQCGQWFRRVLAQRRTQVVVASVVSVAAAVATTTAVWMFGLLIDRVNQGSTAAEVMTIVGLIGVALVTGAVLTGVSQYQIAVIGETAVAQLREDTVSATLNLPTETVEKAGSGDVLSRVGDDVALVGRAVAGVVPQIVMACVIIVVSIFAMAGLDWRIGLAGLAALPAYAIALRLYLRRSGPLFTAMRVAMSQRAQALLSAIRGQRTVRAYRAEAAHISLVNSASAKVFQLYVEVGRNFTRFIGRSMGAEYLGLAAALVAGFVLYRAGQITLGQAAAGALITRQSAGPLIMLMWTLDEIQSAWASLVRLVGVASLKPADTDSSPSSRQAPTVTSIELDAVAHSYDGEHEVLAPFDLRIEPGQRVAIIGASGAGKTTLAAIAAGAFEPTQGRVSLGGVALGEVEPLRQHIAIISQEVHVFSGPLIDDLRLARADASAADAESALRTVGAWDWVQTLPDGLATEVGEEGHQLTPAQSQQLALARLVLADPPAVVLDEATAEAGSAGARQLEAAAYAATAGRTCIVVAHRLSQAAAADRIITMEHGKIVEDGTHDQLLAAGGHYARYWEAWQQQPT